MEKNIWTGIEPANVELPIQVINEYANSFNETFEGKMTMTVKSKIDDSIVVTVESSRTRLMSVVVLRTSIRSKEIYMMSDCILIGEFYP